MIGGAVMADRAGAERVGFAREFLQFFLSTSLALRLRARPDELGSTGATSIALPIRPQLDSHPSPRGRGRFLHRLPRAGFTQCSVCDARRTGVKCAREDDRALRHPTTEGVSHCLRYLQMCIRDSLHSSAEGGLLKAWPRALFFQGSHPPLSRLHWRKDLCASTAPSAKRS